jgi:hypothetical protein
LYSFNFNKQLDNLIDQLLIALETGDQKSYNILKKNINALRLTRSVGQIPAYIDLFNTLNNQTLDRERLRSNLLNIQLGLEGGPSPLTKTVIPRPFPAPPSSYPSSFVSPEQVQPEFVPPPSYPPFVEPPLSSLFGPPPTSPPPEQPLAPPEFEEVTKPGQFLEPSPQLGTPLDLFEEALYFLVNVVLAQNIVTMYNRIPYYLFIIINNYHTPLTPMDITLLKKLYTQLQAVLSTRLTNAHEKQIQSIIEKQFNLLFTPELLAILEIPPQPSVTPASSLRSPFPTPLATGPFGPSASSPSAFPSAPPFPSVAPPAEFILPGQFELPPPVPPFQPAAPPVASLSPSAGVISPPVPPFQPAAPPVSPLPVALAPSPFGVSPTPMPPSPLEQSIGELYRLLDEYIKGNSSWGVFNQSKSSDLIRLITTINTILSTYSNTPSQELKTLLFNIAGILQTSVNIHTTKTEAHLLALLNQTFLNQSWVRKYTR